MFGRIAIVNRGEAAMRLINAVRELRYERRVDLRTIALHVGAERSAMFVREADEAVCIDTDRDPAAGSPYLDIETLGAALVAARADAAWVGWGFVAERPEFAERCDDLGVVFIGPRPDVMRVLGDKIGAKRLAERAAVPVAEWSGGPVDSVTEASAVGERIGYPLMVKATAGGGGRGIRRVDRPTDLAEAFASARAEGAKAFGDPTVFMERVVTDARHVEVQIIGDHHGTTWAVGVRDCSLQRRNQKVIEESHCSALTPQQDTDLRASAVRLARLAEYTNAGTVEFLYQPSERRFAFLEVNTRLQVEHPITEQTNGLDLVKLQILVASGEALSGDPPSTASTRGYAIEARLNAEDPERGFAPAPGTIETLVLPAGPGIRVDTGVAEGDVIPPEFDSMIAKVIATGRDRDEALGRLHRALSQTVVVVRGGTTNKSFLLGLLDHPVVRDGTADTGWLDRLTAADEHLTSRNADIALVAAALDASAESERVRRRRFLAWAGRGRPIVDGDVGHVIELRHGTTPYRVTVREIGPSRFAVGFDDSRAVVRSESLGRARSRLTIEGATDAAASHSILSSIQDTDHLVEVDGVVHRFSRDDAGMVRAPATALVVAVDVEPGKMVHVGDRLLVVEAMKMEIAITAPLAGRVVDVLVARNVQVDAGAPLVRIEQLGDHEAGAAAPTSARLTLADGLARDRPDPQAVEAYLLGFDITIDEARAALGSTTPEDEVALVELFADLCALAP